MCAAQQNIYHVPVWRWCFFLAWAIPLWRLTRIAMYLFLGTLETQFLISRSFIYYTIGIKVGLCCELCCRC